jgi:hypothetical protein
MYGPAKAAAHEQENAGYMMNLFLTLGIVSALVVATAIAYA